MLSTLQLLFPLSEFQIFSSERCWFQNALSHYSFFNMIQLQLTVDFLSSIKFGNTITEVCACTHFSPAYGNRAVSEEL